MFLLVLLEKVFDITRASGLEGFKEMMPVAICPKNLVKT